MNENTLQKIIIEEANNRDLTFAKNFNGRNYALMDVDWIGYYDTLDEVKEFLDINDTDCLNCVLDKIKAEIMQLDYEEEDIEYDYNDMVQTEIVHTICREEVLRIIDKYSEESEV